MAGLVKNILKTLFVVAFVVPGIAFGAQAPNVRTSVVKNSIRMGNDANASVRRSATSVIARTANLNNRQTRTTVVKARPIVSRTTANVSARSGIRSAVSNSTVSRATTVSKSSKVRPISDKSTNAAGKGGILSRAGKARATAVFNDVSKISSDYEACRDAYATCMDQFCAYADASYGRCGCSDKFFNLRDTYDNLDTALSMLADFRDNNLAVIGKTSGEVDAMYSSTDAEDAVKQDNSTTQQTLDKIGELLSGSKTDKTANGTSRLFDSFKSGTFANLSDIWSNNNSLIGTFETSDDLSSLEGGNLYRQAATQCGKIADDICKEKLQIQLASGAYSVIVNQDCIDFEKAINTKKEAITQKVREAERILRETRLEEYQAHNSRDFNECIKKVENAIQQVCGEHYEKCLDYTGGMYINTNTGDAVISPTLFGISAIAPKLGDSDILRANKKWDSYIEERKKYAETALDTCRNLAEDIWDTFKRTMIIRIAQEQDAKVQEVKDSCISTIAQCYNTTDDTLSEISQDISDKYSVGASKALTVRNLCHDNVMACAALFGETDGCTYNRATRKIEPVKGRKCGLQALLSYVDSVDSARIAENCENVVYSYAHELCDPKYAYDDYYDYEYQETYPAGCANVSKEELKAELMGHARKYCAFDDIKSDHANNTSALSTDIVNRILKEIFDELGLSSAQDCENEFAGIWGTAHFLSNMTDNQKLEYMNKSFYNKYYGGANLQVLDTIGGGEFGMCLEFSEKLMCQKIDTESVNVNKNNRSQRLAQYDGKQCILQDSWYSKQCALLGGVFSGEQCNIK